MHRAMKYIHAVRMEFAGNLYEARLRGLRSIDHSPFNPRVDCHNVQLLCT
jgi:hypothetical protein